MTPAGTLSGLSGDGPHETERMATVVRLVVRIAATGLLAGMLAGCNGGGGGGGAAKTPDPASEDDKTLYTMGYLLGKRTQQIGMTPEEATVAARGFYDAAAAKEAVVKTDEYGKKIAALTIKRTTERAAAEKERAKPFLEAAAKEEGATVSESGLVYRTITPGTGESPKTTDRVRVHYKGTLQDGKEFDSSYAKGKPAEFGLNRVVKCWQEGIPKMKVGEKAKLTCPSSIAYGDRGNPPEIPGGAALVFEVELLEILPPPPPGSERQPIRLPMPPGGRPSR